MSKPRKGKGKSRASMPNLERLKRKMPGAFRENPVSSPDPGMLEGQNFDELLMRDIDLGEEEEPDKILMVGDLIVKEKFKRLGWDGRMKEIERFSVSKDGVPFTKERLKTGKLVLCPNCSTEEEPVFISYRERKHCWKGHPICSSKGCGEIIGYDDEGNEVWSCQRHKGFLGIGGVHGLHPRPPKQLDAQPLGVQGEAGSHREILRENNFPPQKALAEH